MDRYAKIPIAHFLAFEVDSYFAGRIVLHHAHQILDVGFLRNHYWNPKRGAVVCEYLCKALADNAVDPKSHQRLRRMLPRRAAAEIFIYDQDGSAFIARVIERMVLF